MAHQSRKNWHPGTNNGESEGLMKMLKHWLPLLLAPFLLWTTPSPAADPQDVVLVIPHTHWEGAVFKTREEYLEIGLPHIVKALYLLKKYPNYRFVLDQM